jgi:formylglycine-generating enzyme required for sulfatase activity
VLAGILAAAGIWAQDLPAKRSIDLGGGVNMDLVLIKPGTFMMGSRKDDAGAKPVHEVTITKPFYMGVYEVTQAQWKALMGRNPATFKGNDLPVEQVSWEDCQKFLAKLKKKAGEGMVCRLPTEAEWEYACRAGSKTEYCFGFDVDSLGEYAWFGERIDGKTHPVGQKEPNAWGLYDMHGNVWEWCADWYECWYYGKSPKEDPQGPSEAQAQVFRYVFNTRRVSYKARVLRGGSCYDGALSLLSAYRYRHGAPTVRSHCYGCRVVLSAQE